MNVDSSEIYDRIKQKVQVLVVAYERAKQENEQLKAQKAELEKQLKANVQKAEKTYGKGWNKVSESDDDFVDYQRYLEIYEKMFIDSDRPNAHWYLIAGDDTRFAEVSIFDVIVQRLELALAGVRAERLGRR